MDFTKLEKYQDELTDGAVPGSDICVSVGGRTVFRRQSGYADLAAGKKMHGDELYLAWSGSKLITSSLGMRLAEEGLLDLDAPVAEYLPEYADLTVINNIDGREAVTRAKNTLYVYELFNMTAGFDYNFASPEIAEVRKATDGRCPTREIVRAFAKMPLAHEPGEHFEYSKAHDVLAGLIEVVAGEKMRDYAKRVLFDPLGMNDTSFGAPTAEQQARMAEQYLWREDLGKAALMKKVCNYNLGCEYDSGGAGIVTSCGDYMKFAETIACGGTTADGYRFLKPETIGLWKTGRPLGETAQREFDEKWCVGHTYAYGVRRITDHRAYGASDGYTDFGWGGAAGMRVHICTEGKIAVVYMMHLHNMPDAKTFERNLRNIAFACVNE